MTLPDWLQEPWGQALGDLQGAAPIPLKVTFDGENLELREPASPSITGIWVGEERGAALAVHLAYQLQDQFFPESEGAWGEARPPCPGHSHPATPELLDGEAWWTCPRDGRRIARFGRA